MVLQPHSVTVFNHTMPQFRHHQQSKPQEHIAEAKRWMLTIYPSNPLDVIQEWGSFIHLSGHWSRLPLRRESERGRWQRILNTYTNTGVATSIQTCRDTYIQKKYGSGNIQCYANFVKQCVSKCVQTLKTKTRIETHSGDKIAYLENLIYFDDMGVNK